MARPSVFKVTTKDIKAVLMEDKEMKKKVIIGIVAGAVVLSIAFFGLLGSYLNRSKAAATDVKEHALKIDSVSGEVDAVLGVNGAAQSQSFRSGATADYEYGYDEDKNESAPEAAGSGVSGAPSTSNTVNVDPEKGRLLIRTVSMSAETKDIMSVKNDIEAQVRTAGGYIENSSMSGTGKNRDLRIMYYTIRVPADKLDELITKVGNSCTILSSSENTSDVTLEYVDTKSRMESLRVEYDQLLKLLEQATDLDNIIILQSRLTDVRYQIESAESRIRVLENQVEYGTLNLSITEVLEDTVIEEPHIVTYGERVMDQFNDMWEGTVEFFQDFLLGLIAAIPFLVFMGIVAAVIIIIVFSVRKKRRKREAKALEEAKAEAAKREALKEKKEESKKDQE